MSRSGAPVPLILPSDRFGDTDYGEGPCRDYRKLAHALGDAPILPPPSGGKSLTAMVEERIASDLRQAILALRWRRRVSVYVSLSERIGLPLALLLAARHIRTPHVLVAHHLTSERKRSLQRRTGWLGRFTRIVTVSKAQADYLRDDVRYPEERARFLPHAVDTDFWQPGEGERASPPFVLSVGRERRDYGTLLAAQAKSAFPLTIVASSLWARKEGREGGEEGVFVPPGVTLRRGLSFCELRALYARAAVVAVPLEAGTAYGAGATGLLEGMAMGKPVVLTDTPGLTGYAMDTVYRVPPSDPASLSDAVQTLLGDSMQASSLGESARRSAVESHSLSRYVSDLAEVVRLAESEG